MIGGLLIDALVLGAIVAFAWAGRQLGGLASLERLLASAAALVVAVLLREPAGTLAQAALGASDDFCNLVGMGVAGAGTYIAVTRVFEWWLARREPAYEDEETGDPLADPLDTPTVATVSGGLLGFGWAVIFVALLVLLPAASPVTFAAIRSTAGGVLIGQEDMLRWIVRGFPHYTQTLPKGDDGAVVGEQDALPMRGEIEPAAPKGDDADVLLRAINRMRTARKTQALTFNTDVAAVARRHATALATEKVLSYESPGGGTLDRQVQAALGDVAPSFGPETGIEVVWAHSPANAGAGIRADERAERLLSDDRWTEIGIGVVDAGWFNGRIYVLLLIGPDPADAGADAESDGAGDAATGDAAVDEAGVDAGADAIAGIPGDDPSSDVGGCEGVEPFDLDGDGRPDQESIEPACRTDEPTA